MFHFSSKIQEQQASVQQDSQFKRRPEISGMFWRGRFFIFGLGSFLVFFLNCLGNRGIPIAKNKQQVSLLQQDPRPFASVSGTKTLKTKIKRKFRSGIPRTEEKDCWTEACRYHLVTCFPLLISNNLFTYTKTEWPVSLKLLFPFTVSSKDYILLRIDPITYLMAKGDWCSHSCSHSHRETHLQTRDSFKVLFSYN